MCVLFRSFPLWPVLFIALWGGDANVVRGRGVSCGAHRAPICDDCTQGHGKSWCNGDCIYVDGECVRKKRDGVSCGGHRAPNCALCTRGRGAAWCNGDCRWAGSECVQIPWMGHADGSETADDSEEEEVDSTTEDVVDADVPDWLRTKLVAFNSCDVPVCAPGDVGCSTATADIAENNIAEGRERSEKTAAVEENSGKVAATVLDAVTSMSTTSTTTAKIDEREAAAGTQDANETCNSGREVSTREMDTKQTFWATRLRALYDSLGDRDTWWTARAAEVRDAVVHSWRGYRQHAWGMDELRPVSRKGRNGFGGVGAMILDSLSTLWIMNLTKEFNQAAEFVETDLVWGQEDDFTSVFELIIRALGGLLSAHALSDRAIFLQRARELGELLLPAFNTSSRMPLAHINLQAGILSSGVGHPTIIAEAGSVQLELRSLAAESGDLRFKDVADASFNAIQSTGFRGILPALLTPADEPPPIKVTSSNLAVGGQVDSYYEYLLKQWVQSRKEGYFKELFLDVMRELPALVRPSPEKTGWAAPRYKLIELDQHGKVNWKMEHLSCFVPGMIAFAIMTLPHEDIKANRSNWFRLAEGLTASCAEMWTLTRTGLAPEHMLLSPKPPHRERKKSRTGVPKDRFSLLRPETAESLYYMFRLTTDAKYRRWGEQMFRAIQSHSKISSGYASILNVDRMPTRKQDLMHTFVMAETFKYLYLLFSPPLLLDMNEFVLNTEGHPLRRFPNSHEW